MAPPTRSSQVSVARAPQVPPLPASDADADLNLAEKVARLRPVIDRRAKDEGIDPDTQATAVADYIRGRWSEVQWAEAALEAGLPAPDAELRAAVIDDYRGTGFKHVDCFIVDPVRDGRGAP